MNGNVSDVTETDEDILTFDMPDDALERVARFAPLMTLAPCTFHWRTIAPGFNSKASFSLSAHHQSNIWYPRCNQDMTVFEMRALGHGLVLDGANDRRENGAASATGNHL
jgi:hypothetical protein